MPMTKDAVILEAMDLSEEKRLEIVWQLSQSVDGIAAAWQVEIDRRLVSIADGSAKLISWEKVRAQLLGATDAASGCNFV